MKILEWEFENDFEKRYQAIVDRLKKLPVYILITRLEQSEIRKRMLHRERTSQWRTFCSEKLKLRGYDDLELLSINQQKAYFEAAEAQGIPYSAIHVELD